MDLVVSFYPHVENSELVVFSAVYPPAKQNGTTSLYGCRKLSERLILSFSVATGPASILSYVVLSD